MHIHFLKLNKDGYNSRMFVHICLTTMQNRVIILVSPELLDMYRVDFMYFTIVAYKINNWSDTIFDELLRVMANCLVLPFDKDSPSKFIDDPRIVRYSGFYAGGSVSSIDTLLTRILDALTIGRNPETHKNERNYKKIDLQDQFMRLTKIEPFSLNDPVILYTSSAGVEKKYIVEPAESE